MADISDLAQKIGFYKAGGKDPGTSNAERFGQGFDMVSGIINNVLSTKKALLESQKIGLENQQKQGELTPYRDIVSPLTPANSTINADTTPEQRTAMDSLYSQREAMGNQTLDQAKQGATINYLQSGVPLRNAQTKVALNGINDNVYVSKDGKTILTDKSQIPAGQEANFLEFGKKEATPKVLGSILTPAGQTSDQDVQKTVDSIVGGHMALSQLPGGLGANSLKAKVITKLNTLYPNFSWIKNEADFQAVKDYTKYINSGTYQNTIKYLESVQPNLDEVVRLSDSLDKTKYPLINQAQLAIMKGSGDPNAAAFGAAGLEVADQVAKILQGGGTGNATSDAKLNQASQILNGNFSPQQFRAVAGELKTLLASRQSSLESDTVKTLGIGAMPGSHSSVSHMPQTQQSKPIPGKYDSYLAGIDKASKGVTGLQLQYGLKPDEATAAVKDYIARTHK